MKKRKQKRPTAIEIATVIAEIITAIAALIAAVRWW